MAYVGSINQIPALVDSVAAQALGKSALTVAQSDGIVSLATMFSTGTDKEKFYNALCNRIAKTVVDVETWDFNGHGSVKDTVGFNQIYQIITLDIGNASNDNAFMGVNSWDSATRGTQNNPYNNTVNTSAKMYLFSGVAGFSYKDVVPTIQIDSAFTSNESMASFIGGVYLMHQNALAAYVFGVENVVFGRAMIESWIAAIGGVNTNVSRNPLYEYNRNVLGLTLTLDEDNEIVYPDGWVMKTDALYNKGFMKYVIEQLQLTYKRMSDPTALFNIAKHTTQTKSPKLEVLEDFASAGRVTMSEVYHNDVLSLPNYKSVSFWQSPSRTGYTDYSFGANSAINVAYTDEEAGNYGYEGDGIIAYIYDDKHIIMNCENYRSYSLFNPDDEVLNTYDKADVHWIIAKHRNAVVFQIADPTVTSDTHQIMYNEYGDYTVTAIV